MSGQTLIAIAGRQGSGKTTMASTLVASGSVRLSIAAPIKRMVRDAYGDLGKHQTIHSGGESITVREMYQRIGVALRSVDPDLLMRMLQPDLEAAIAAGYSVVIDDVRLQSEADWLRARGFYIIRLWVPAEIRRLRLGHDLIGNDDATEASVDDIIADTVVEDLGSVDERMQLAGRS